MKKSYRMGKYNTMLIMRKGQSGTVIIKWSGA